MFGILHHSMDVSTGVCILKNVQEGMCYNVQPQVFVSAKSSVINIKSWVKSNPIVVLINIHVPVFLYINYQRLSHVRYDYQL